MHPISPRTNPIARGRRTTGMGRAAAEQPPAAGDRSARPARRRAVRAVAALAVVVGAVALALLPGDRVDRSTPLERTLAASSVADAQPPTVETVQALAAELGDIAGEGYDQPIDPDRVASVVTVPGDYEVLGRLEIPAIGVDAEIGNGVDPITLDRGPGHWIGTPVAGSAWQRRHLRPPDDSHRAFPRSGPAERRRRDQRPDDVRQGDDVSGHRGGRGPGRGLHGRGAGPAGRPPDRELTLFACHPEGSLTHRIVVTRDRRRHRFLSRSTRREELATQRPRRRHHRVDVGTRHDQREATSMFEPTTGSPTQAGPRGRAGQARSSAAAR